MAQSLEMKMAIIRELAIIAEDRGVGIKGLRGINISGGDLLDAYLQEGSRGEALFAEMIAADAGEVAEMITKEGPNRTLLVSDIKDSGAIHSFTNGDINLGRDRFCKSVYQAEI